MFQNSNNNRLNHEDELFLIVIVENNVLCFINPFNLI